MKRLLFLVIVVTLTTVFFSGCAIDGTESAEIYRIPTPSPSVSPTVTSSPAPVREITIEPAGKITVESGEIVNCPIKAFEDGQEIDLPNDLIYGYLKNGQFCLDDKVIDQNGLFWATEVGTYLIEARSSSWGIMSNQLTIDVDPRNPGALISARVDEKGKTPAVNGFAELIREDGHVQTIMFSRGVVSFHSVAAGNYRLRIIAENRVYKWPDIADVWIAVKTDDQLRFEAKFIGYVGEAGTE